MKGGKPVTTKFTNKKNLKCFKCGRPGHFAKGSPYVRWGFSQKGWKESLHTLRVAVALDIRDFLHTLVGLFATAIKGWVPETLDELF